MSILFASNDGWIISHLDYINSIYKSVEDEHEKKTLRFNEILFKVNSQYLRQNQIESQNNAEANIKSLKKRKRNKSQTLPPEVLQQNNFIKETSIKILNDVKNLKLFGNEIPDNNTESRLESKKFYIDNVHSNYNYHGSNQKNFAIINKFQNEKYVFPDNSEFYCYDVREINTKLSITDHFDLIVMDPPWWNKSIRRKKAKFEESSYKMMYNEEFSKIPIGSLLKSNGIVAVWCTNSVSQIKSILEEMFPAWGVTFKARWYWLKVTQNGETICDFNETHGKQPYEQIILGTVSSNLNLNLPDKRVIISIPSAVHSHKPPLAEIFKPYLPEKPKCMEIFARYLLPKWSSWGLEVLKFQHLSLYTTLAENALADDNTSR